MERIAPNAAEIRSTLFIPPEVLSEFEARISMETTPGDAIYDSFSELALQTQYAEDAYRHIKRVVNFDQYSATSNVSRVLKAHLAAEVVLQDNSWAVFEPIGKHEIIDEYKAEYEALTSELGSDLYFASYLVDSRQTPGTKASIREMTRGAVIGREFLHIYGTRIATSPSLEDYTKSMTIATDPFCVAKALQDTTSQNLATKFINNLTNQMITFANEHPENAEAAFKLWEQRVAVLAQEDIAVCNLLYLGNHILKDWRTTETIQAKMGGQTFEFTEPYFTDQIETYKKIKEPKNVNEMIAVASFRSLEKNEDTVTLLRNLQDSLMISPPTGKAKLMQSGIDLLMNYLSYASPLNPQAANLQKVFKDRQGDHNLGFSSFVQFANLVSPTLQQLMEARVKQLKEVAPVEEEDIQPETVEKLCPLNEKDITDFPDALRRLSAFIRGGMQEDDIDELDNDILEGMSEAAYQLASVGANRKLDEKVVTLGDLILKYPKATPEMLQALIENMQRNRSEMTVNRTYRELRGRHKSKANFTKWAAGKGLLS